MQELTIRLNSVPDSYYDFIEAVLTYVKKKTSRLNTVTAFLDEHPAANTSEILEFISNQDDFYEDAAPAQGNAG
ncbi:MAG: hypothetical protein J5825_08110 [Lachnospiraceae bacterium]|nr:hypothetical protein [Lachnospiraceae bacterium]